MCQPQPFSGGDCSLGLGRGVCLNGDCVACVTANDCTGSPGQCKKWECRSNRCQATSDDSASCTVGLLTAGFCSGGRCLECQSASDCRGLLSACETFTCVGGRCGKSTAEKVGSRCLTAAGVGGTCDRVGACLECTSNTQCRKPSQVCSNGKCVCPATLNLQGFDPNNCGACERVCRAPTPHCVNGKCSQCDYRGLGCPAGTYCDASGGTSRCVAQ